MGKLYCGIDLHSNNSVLVVQNRKEGRLLKRRLPNRLEGFVDSLEPYRERLAGIAVESTYNWYWLVDGLMDSGHRLHLVSTSKIQQYEGLKYTDDVSDASWLALLLELGILPEGYIYPKEERPWRDLLRRRGFLVRQRTASLLALGGIHVRSTGRRVRAADVLRWDAESLRSQVGDERVRLEMDCLANVIGAQNQQIRTLEKTVLSHAKRCRNFELLKTIGGIGDVLALTIGYETGDIGRFEKVGNYGSYCRCVRTERTSNGKRKGTGNGRNGNPHLSWAFAEAAYFARRYVPEARRFYDRKKAKKGPAVASRALSNKLARAAYWVLRNQVPFDVSRAFAH